MTQTIKLGDQQFEVRPLKLGQLRGLLDALDEMEGKAGAALIDAAAKVVSAGLAQSRPDMTPDQILDLTATVADLTAAVSAIIVVAGLTPAGESEPVATSEVKSAPFTAPSPPAADTTTATSTS